MLIFSTPSSVSCQKKTEETGSRSFLHLRKAPHGCWDDQGTESRAALCEHLWPWGETTCQSMHRR